MSNKYAGDEPPLRSELFSADQMEQHGKTLAASHQLSPGRARDQLLTRLAENEDVLIEVRNLLTDAVQANRRITPAGEWLLDNFYLIEEQIRTAKRHLPKGYSRELPRLLNGPSAGLPRVYDIALETISHGDGRVDPESLSQLRRGLPDGHRPEVGRTVGHSDHAAPGADRESPARWSTGRRRQDRPKPRRLLGGPDDGDRREGSEEPDSGDRGHGAVEPAHGRARLSRNLRAGCRDRAPLWRCRSPGSSSGSPSPA